MKNAYTDIETREELESLCRKDLVKMALEFIALRATMRERSLELVVDEWERRVDRLDELTETDPDNRDGFWPALERWAAYWALCGMPTVLPSDQLAASFMSTKMNREVAEFVQPPWAAFLCVIPAGVVGVQESLVAVHMSKSLELAHHHKRYPDWDPGNNMRAVLGNGDTDEWLMIGSEDLAALSDYDYASGITEQQRDRERAKPRSKRRRILPTADETRFVRLAARLVFGCCAEFDTRTGVVIGPRPRLRNVGGGRRSALPSEWVIRLTRAVSIDCRNYVKAYASGQRGSISTQHMTRGHWKNQPHGPRNTLRKFIHVEPYWSGPDGAPIAVRPHILKKAAE